MEADWLQLDISSRLSATLWRIMTCKFETAFKLPEGTNIEALVRSPDDYSIEVHETLEAAEKAWRHLEQEGECFAFQTYDWVKTWHELIGTKLGVAPQIVVLRAPCGELAMLIPLGIRREMGLRQLSFLAHSMSDYQGPLMSKGVGERLAGDFAALWSRIMERLPYVDLIDFRRMPKVIGNAPNPFVQLAGARETERAYAAHLPSTFQAFLTGKRKSIHRDSLRKLRRLAEIGEVAFEIVEVPEKAEKVVEIMAHQKGPRYVEAFGFNWFERMPEVKTFYARIGALRSEHLRGHVSIMTVGGAVVSTHVGMVLHDRFYMLLPSYAGGEWYKYSTGRLLLEHLMETSIGEGCTVFDYTVGDDAYKKDWTDVVLPLFTLTTPLSLKAYIHQRAIAAKHALRKGLKNVSWIRGAVVHVRAKLRRKSLVQAEEAARSATGKIDQAI
jgi:CelD/BcsL family acetyltransferase involved in cellulose biosynthesis